MLCYLHIRLGDHHVFGGQSASWCQIASFLIAVNQIIFSGFLLAAVEKNRAVHRSKVWDQLK